MSKLDELDGHLAHLPRVALALTPTPIEAMPRLSQHVGGAALLAVRCGCWGRCRRRCRCLWRRRR